MTGWVTVKLVMSDNGSQHIGCVVGPFANIEQATEHASRAVSLPNYRRHHFLGD
jgi:hypothetical protein